MHVRVLEPILDNEIVKKKVCAYARVSTFHDKQEESLESQIQYYENKILNNPEYEFCGVFADRGISGYSDKRPEFQRMLKLCRRGEVDLIITKSISRFARNTTVILRTIRELKLLGVAVLFEKENINTMAGDGELILTVLSAFAEEESRNVSENLKWRSRKKFERGELIINTTRFLGYDKDEFGELIINSEEAKVIGRIYYEYVQGKSIYRIAKNLNMDGIPTVGGKCWSESSISLILKNEKYKGDALLQKYYTPENMKKRSVKNNEVIESYYINENHSPIVARETWNAVQELICKRKAERSALGDTKKYTQRYTLSGKLFCGKCGVTLKRRTWNSKNSSKKIVWQCSNYVRNGKNACTGTSIDDEIVSRLNIKDETIVEEIIKDGKKHYSYTSKSEKSEYSRTARTTEKKDGSLLQSVNRPIRTAIKL